MDTEGPEIEGLERIDNDIWQVPVGYKPGMRVPGRIYLSDKLFANLEKEAVDQVANVATLPGIQKFSMAMPDAHVGYGFPIGGVAAFDAEEGVISPGGVGFDINCGVRLIRSNLEKSDVDGKVNDLLDSLFKAVPSGVGSKSRIRASESELEAIFTQGSRWAVEQGYGVEADLTHCEGEGCIEGGDPAQVSAKARKRGRPQLGTLGSGNHFLELQYVDEIYDPVAAEAFNLK